MLPIQASTEADPGLSEEVLQLNSLAIFPLDEEDEEDEEYYESSRSASSDGRTDDEPEGQDEPMEVSNEEV